MENPPEKKSIWKKAWPGPRGFVAWWLGGVVGTFVVVFLIGLVSESGKRDSAFLMKASLVAAGAAIAVGLIVSLLRWLCCWRNLRKALFGLVCLATLIALFYAEEDARGKWAWSRFKHERETKGEKFDYAGFIPPAVPDDQNFAMTPIMVGTYGSMIDKNGHEIRPRNSNVVDRLQVPINRIDEGETPAIGNWANGTVTDLRLWQTYYRAPLTNNHGAIETNEFPTAPQPQSPAEDVLLALSKYDSVLSELDGAAKMPYSRFPLEYDKEDPATILLPHLAGFKRAALCLRVRAIAELQAGHSEKALADVQLALYLVNAPRSEPFLVSHMVRVGILNIALQPIYEGLADHRWSDAQLTALDAELAKFDFILDYQFCLRGEMVFVAREIDYLKQTRQIDKYLNFYNGPLQEDHVLAAVAHVAPGGWFARNQITMARFYLDGCLPAMDVGNRQFLPKVVAQTDVSTKAAIAHPAPGNMLLPVFLSSAAQWFRDSYQAAERFAYTQESVDLARVAIALERYRIAHGEYSDSLEELVPKFIDRLPHDIIGGKSLVYRKSADNFLLYSVGWNERDDGGAPVLADDYKLNSVDGDWVWTYPKK